MDFSNTGCLGHFVLLFRFLNVSFDCRFFYMVDGICNDRFTQHDLLHVSPLKSVELMITQKMAYQWRSDFYGGFTMILCALKV